MKIYIDTMILSNIIGLHSRLTEENAIALQTLATSSHEFITSPLMKSEMAKCSDQRVKGAMLFLYKVFTGKKDLSPETDFKTGFGDSLFGTIRFGGEHSEKTMLTMLKSVFKPEDARHIFQSIQAKANYFLTLDGGILNQYKNNHKGIRTFCEEKRLKIVNLTELTEDLNK